MVFGGKIFEYRLSDRAETDDYDFHEDSFLSSRDKRIIAHYSKNCNEFFHTRGLGSVQVISYCP
jgi:hypothetical protein